LKKTVSEVDISTKRLLIHQSIVGLTVSLVFYLSSGIDQAIAALYGAFSTLSVSSLLAYGVIRANKTVLENPSQSMGILYAGAAQRFVLVLGLFIFGLAVLKLDPIATALTFGITQLMFVFNLKKKSQ